MCYPEEAEGFQVDSPGTFTSFYKQFVRKPVSFVLGCHSDLAWLVIVRIEAIQGLQQVAKQPLVTQTDTELMYGWDVRC